MARELRVVPVTIKAAAKWVVATHRHLKRFNGGRFAVGVADATGALRGVGVVGNGPQVWEGTGRMIITRVATDGFPNACSMLYGALCRAGKNLGYIEAWTYTMPSEGETGASLKAAGFTDMGLTKGGEHDRPNIGRRRAKAENANPKRRWVRRLQ